MFHGRVYRLFYYRFSWDIATVEFIRFIPRFRGIVHIFDRITVVKIGAHVPDKTGKCRDAESRNGKSFSKLTQIE
ncbi:hypothetical protein PHLCEN_2v11287 [Hermanssonia centrifuga]|uniref:Uncharacterized protein n=1 Tax=Hermanssonia centrifuga TaxID=98765 RepID=A0A2R6NKE9_9APHY|nr:hypothetical protein PHLCEN_2v11287 [Hermanssonia centrifuga]